MCRDTRKERREGGTNGSGEFSDTGEEVAVIGGGVIGVLGGFGCLTACGGEHGRVGRALLDEGRGSGVSNGDIDGDVGGIVHADDGVGSELVASIIDNIWLEGTR